MMGTPRILVEPSAHHLLNLGDAAMLQMAVERFAGLWPTASIRVITESPERLARLCPLALPVDAGGRSVWFQGRPLTHTLHRLLPDPASRRLVLFEASLRRSSPATVESLLHSRARLRGRDGRPLREFLAAVREADVVVATGAGLLTDDYARLAVDVLDLLDLAKRRHGAVTALLGHGIGPIGDAALLRRAGDVLPTVDLITLREELVGRPLLRSLGVDPDRIATTGDDALELAFRVEPAPAPGTRLGFNLRLARYSRVDQGSADMIGAAILGAARRHAAEPLPIAISLHPKERDDAVADRLLGLPAQAEVPDSPLDVVRRIQQCRIVVTGSYHAAVFALAQGIPAVGITQSPYYDAKFLGLKDQFDGLLGVVPVGRDVEARLTHEVDQAWQTADDVRPRLLELAALQVEEARSAYRRLAELVTRGAPT